MPAPRAYLLRTRCWYHYLNKRWKRLCEVMPLCHEAGGALCSVHEARGMPMWVKPWQSSKEGTRARSAITEQCMTLYRSVKKDFWKRPLGKYAENIYRNPKSSSRFTQRQLGIYISSFFRPYYDKIMPLSSILEF